MIFSKTKKKDIFLQKNELLKNQFKKKNILQTLCTKTEKKYSTNILY